MYYGLFDFQFTKEVLLRNPRLYAFGPKNENFDLKRFWGWISTAWV